MLKERTIDNLKNKWTTEEVRAIWEKGTLLVGYEPSEWRKDSYGKEIKYDHFGNKNSDYGWEIAHTNLISNSAFINTKNLQPLHWRNNHYENLIRPI